ncbi:hypothetical protein COOONC_00294 [Cooperia oncophora]
MFSNERAVILASSGTPSVETEYSDILGEMTYKETSVRMKTGDITTFCKLEELGRCLGIRFLTTFICRSTENPHRTLHIRYYDELKANGSRVIRDPPVSVRSSKGARSPSSNG